MICIKRSGSGTLCDILKSWWMALTKFNGHCGDLKRLWHSHVYAISGYLDSYSDHASGAVRKTHERIMRTEYCIVLKSATGLSAMRYTQLLTMHVQRNCTQIDVRTGTEATVFSFQRLSHRTTNWAPIHSFYDIYAEEEGVTLPTNFRNLRRACNAIPCSPTIYIKFSVGHSCGTRFSCLPVH